MTREFEEFAEKASVSNEELAFESGVIWYSYRRNGPSGNYQAELPAGLHISCGIANIRSYSRHLGGFSGHGPIANVLYVPEDGVEFSTQLRAGPVSSFGYYIPKEALSANDSVAASIFASVKNKPLIEMEGRILRSVPRLTSVVGDDYIAKNREMLFHSRALELSAMIAAELGQVTAKRCSLRMQKKMYEVRECIEADLAVSITLEDLAKLNGMSVRVMTSAYRETFGESIQSFVIRRRLEEGAAMLESGAAVAIAAAATGYTPNAFSTAFTRQFGYSPSQIIGHKRRIT